MTSVADPVQEAYQRGKALQDVFPVDGVTSQQFPRSSRARVQVLGKLLSLAVHENPVEVSELTPDLASQSVRKWRCLGDGGGRQGLSGGEKPGVEVPGESQP
jgi:hypothetical protein